MTIGRRTPGGSGLGAVADVAAAVALDPTQPPPRQTRAWPPARLDVGRHARAEHRVPTEVAFPFIVESIPHIVWMAARDGSIEYFNRWGIEYTGLSPQAGGARTWVWLVHPEDAERARCAWELASRTVAPYELEYRIRRADGQFRWHSVRGLPVTADDDRVVSWVGTATDFEDHKQLELSLRRSEREAVESLTVLQKMQSAAPVGFCFVDRDFRIRRINETLARVNGSSVDEHLGRTVAEMVPEIWPQISDIYRRALSGESVLNLEVSGPSAEEPGRTLHWLTSYYPVRIDGDIVGVGNVIVGITERKQAEEFRSVVMDTMTEGLFTLDGEGRLTFMNRAAATMLGWSEGELHGRHKHETIHFQYADGTPVPAEDCAFLKTRTEGRAVRMAEEAFTRKDGSIFPVSCSSAPLRVGSSVEGAVVVFRDLTEEKEDQARVRRELAALSWVGRIRDALDEDRMVLYSQPIIPLGNGEGGEELLLRMVGRAGEIILPGSFLPVAEKYGLIGEIDHWVTIQAVALAATGRRVEANLSAASIGTLDLLPLIARELRNTGADPANLIFEITETTLMGDIEGGEAFARGLAELGCRLALDDFGTGFGSFTYLKKLPMNYLKIDVEFVRDLATNPANLHVVRAIVGLAHAFGLQTIAEGVQDEPTMSLLRREGVDFAQGFHLGRPAPINPRQGEALSGHGRLHQPSADSVASDPNSIGS